MRSVGGMEGGREGGRAYLAKVPQGEIERINLIYFQGQVFDGVRGAGGSTAGGAHDYALRGGREGEREGGRDGGLVEYNKTVRQKQISRSPSIPPSLSPSLPQNHSPAMTPQTTETDTSLPSLPPSLLLLLLLHFALLLLLFLLLLLLQLLYSALPLPRPRPRPPRILAKHRARDEEIPLRLPVGPNLKKERSDTRRR